jgi:hypothetical protein
VGVEIANIFKLGFAWKLIRQIKFESLGVEPRTKEIEARTLNPNQELFSKI